MEYPRNQTTLCSACKALTFAQLFKGYNHPLLYAETVSSGKTCRLCRLIICSMSKLQTSNNCYAADKRYDFIAEELSQLPMVSRSAPPGFPPIETMSLPSVITWSRQNYLAEPGLLSDVRKGNFNNGETIQITADRKSLYQICNMIPLKSIEAASSPRNHQMFRDWVSNCVNGHQSCRQFSAKPSNDQFRPISTPPTRVIDVGSIKNLSMHPRLVSTNGLQVSYVALSHRWAQTNTLKTNSGNLSSHEKELPEKDIPPTFRDALIVTRQLGFQYLWIDSLCIIQDDPEEWRRESRIMGSIFAGASVTIAAVDSVDENGIDHGMLLQRSDPLSVTIPLPYAHIPLLDLSRKVFGVDDRVYVWRYQWLATRDSTHDSIYEQNKITLRPRIASLYQTVRRSQWYNRGWILQERLLACRIIYFMKEKVYWSCFSATHEEEGGDPKAAIRSSLYSTSLKDPLGCWHKIVSEYVNCRLSFNTDRLAAIEGISQIVETCSSLKIHAGIADDETARSLLWYTERKPLQKFSDFHAPTWTWASLGGIISFDMPPPLRATPEPLVKNLRFDVKAACDGTSLDDCCRSTCVSGKVSFTSPVGSIRRSTRLKAARLYGAPDDPISNYDVLRLLLGSAIDYLGSTIPRYDVNGDLVPTTPHLFVPDHTELLVDYGVCVGFFIPDMERDGDDEIDITCASITAWTVHRGIQENDTVDIIGMQAADQSHGTFRRVGRGRVICNAWLPSCEERDIVII